MTRPEHDIPRFIHDLAAGDIPQEVMHMARRAVLDTLGVWAAGSATEPGRISRNHAARRYPGTLPLPFDGRLVNPVGFAFSGAASIDAVDGHDGHQLCKGHASVALLPALLAEAGDDRSLTSVLADFVVGSEIAIRAGLALHATVPDYHSSGAWNALGVAGIAVRNRSLSRTKTWEALGIAEYYGPRAQMMRCIDFPTMVKDSSAWGALAGISAADLAEDGFTGAPALTCSSTEVSRIWADLGDSWRLLETNFKAYPVCRWAHPAIEGVRQIVAAEGIAHDDVAAIEVSTFAEATRLDTRRPAGSDAAQYSLPVAVALALVDGDVLPEALAPERFRRPEVLAIVDAVTLTRNSAYDAVFPAERFADVTLRHRDGRSFTASRVAARGNFDAPLSDQALLEKFARFSAPALPDEARGRLVQILAAPDEAPGITEILELLTPRAMAAPVSPS